MAARFLSAAAIACAAAINIVGTSFGAPIVGVSTAAKFAALTLLVLAALVLGSSHGASLSNRATTTGAQLVTISSFSSLNGSMLAAPRVFFAMADDGLFFKAIASVHYYFFFADDRVGFR